MNFNLVGSLLAVSSERGTVHVFRLGSGQQGGQGDGASSPSESVDGTTQGLDGGYDAFIEKKKSASVSYVLLSFVFNIYCSYSLTNSSWRFIALHCDESPYK